VALNARGRPASFALPDGEWRAVHGEYQGEGALRVPAISGVVLVQRP